MTLEELKTGLAEIRSNDHRSMAVYTAAPIVGVAAAEAIVAQHSDAQIAEFLREDAKAWAAAHSDETEDDDD